MHDPKLSEDVVPVAEFKGQAARWLKRAGESGQPVVVTLRGKVAGVVLSPAEYDRLRERVRLLEDVLAGIEDADAGRVYTTEEVRKQLGLRRARRRR
jgi:prevent-host-death family protein